MGLTNVGILAGATVSASGGTAVSYTPDGLSVKNGLHLIDASVTDPDTSTGHSENQKSCTFTRWELRKG